MIKTRDRSRHPVFQHTFVVQRFLDYVDQRFAPYDITELHQSTRFDLSLFVDDGPNNIQAYFDYATHLYKHSTVVRIADHYVHLVEQMVVNLEAKVSATQLMRETEYQQIVHTWNQTDASYPQDKTIHQLFEEQVKKTPGAIALIFENETLTYSELNQQANQLACAVRSQYRKCAGEELLADTLVALYFDRGLAMVVAMLAVLKAGGAYVPIAPDYPKARTRFMLQDTQAPVVLTQNHYLTRLTDWTDTLSNIPTVITIDNIDQVEDLSSKNLTQISAPTDLAYVIYTSGTTGQPKGVLIPHRGVTSLVCDNQYIDISSDDTFLQLSNTNFDAATFEIWGALTHGSRLVIPNAEASLSAEQLESVLKRYQVSILWLTRTLFDSLYIQHSDLFGSLRYLLIGGEALTAELIRKLINQDYRPQYIINGFGPTESTTFTTMYLCGHIDDSIPIGKPINTRKVYVLSERLAPVPIGVPGELCIGGAGLACGYLNQSKLTAEHFIDNPFATKADKAKGYTQLYKNWRYCALVARWQPGIYRSQ